MTPEPALVLTDPDFGGALDLDLIGVPDDSPSAAALTDEGDAPSEDLRQHLDLPTIALYGTSRSNGSNSGLSKQHREAARHAAVAAAVLALNKRDRIDYTQGPERWDGIANDRFSRRGDFPRHADCSAFVTWCIYQGVRFYDLRDVVNGANWKAGYTGTMLNHGKRVLHDRNLELADAILYGQPGTTGAHTALYVGGGKVISHGSTPGPFLLPIDYRSDRMQARRYI